MTGEGGTGVTLVEGEVLVFAPPVGATLYSLLRQVAADAATRASDAEDDAARMMTAAAAGGGGGASDAVAAAASVDAARMRAGAARHAARLFSLLNALWGRPLLSDGSDASAHGAGDVSIVQKLVSMDRYGMVCGGHRIVSVLAMQIVSLL